MPAIMAVYYRYKSGVDTFSVPVAAPSIPVADLKRLILGTARHGHGRTRGRGQRESVALYDSTTGEEYADDGALVPRSSTVLVRRRVAGPPAEAITLASQPPPPKVRTRDGGTSSSDSSAVTASNSPAEDDEDRAIAAVIDAAQLHWGDQHRGAGGFSRPSPVPPSGYVCHRCRVPGHFIQHCPTNGDPRYDVRPRTSFNFSTNLPTPSPASPSPEDDDGVPPELHCKICSKVMADAVVSSRCCFGSFCDACVRGQIAAKSRCVCGGQARADDLVPNLTLRATIAKLLATKAAGSGSASTTDNRKSSAGSNAEPTSQENLSHVSATAISESEHSDGSASSSSTSKSAAAAAPAAAREPARTKQTTAVSQEIAARTGFPEQCGYGYGGGPACYDPVFFGANPWACDPYTYYGMPYNGGYHDGWGWNGRKRTADEEYQRHAEGGFKRRCGSRSEVAV